MLLSLMVHCYVHKSQSPVPVLSQINATHTLPSHFIKIHFNIILASVHKYSKFFAFFNVFHHKPEFIFLLSSAFHMSCPSQPPWFIHPNIWWGVTIMKLPSMAYSLFSCYFHPLWYKCQTQCEWSVKQGRTHLENICTSLESSFSSLVKCMTGF